MWISKTQFVCHLQNSLVVKAMTLKEAWHCYRSKHSVKTSFHSNSNVICVTVRTSGRCRNDYTTTNLCNAMSLWNHWSEVDFDWNGGSNKFCKKQLRKRESRGNIFSSCVRFIITLSTKIQSSWSGNRYIYFLGKEKIVLCYHHNIVVLNGPRRYRSNYVYTSNYLRHRTLQYGALS